MNIVTVTPTQWLNLINLEAHPDLDKHELSYIELDGSYAAHLHSGYGSFLSPTTKDKAKLPELAAGLLTRHNKAKSGAVAANSLTLFKLA